MSFCQLYFDLHQHPLPIGYGWEMVNDKYRPVRYTEPALPDNGIYKNSEETDSDSHGDQSEYGNSSDSDGEDYL